MEQTQVPARAGSDFHREGSIVNTMEGRKVRGHRRCRGCRGVPVGVCEIRERERRNR